MEPDWSKNIKFQGANFVFFQVPIFYRFFDQFLMFFGDPDPYESMLYTWFRKVFHFLRKSLKRPPGRPQNRPKMASRSLPKWLRELKKSKKQHFDEDNEGNGFHRKKGLEKEPKRAPRGLDPELPPKLPGAPPPTPSPRGLAA